MTVNPTKRYRLNYKVTDRKLREAVIRIIESGVDPTVKLVAQEAGVSLSTAYTHNCQEMILEELMKK
ncbi:MAG: hypothetical protein ACI4EG_13005 [Fusicatenibacter sp.]